MSTCYQLVANYLVTFCMTESYRQREMYIGHARLCVCVCVCVCVYVRGHMPTQLHGPECNFGES